MSAAYDVFLSHAWKDGDRPGQLAEALRQARLSVWFDSDEINDFDSITRVVTGGLIQSKALVAWYSKTYPLRRACQWELTVAFLAAQREGDPWRRVLVVNPEPAADHIHPEMLRDAKFRNAPNNGADLNELAQSIARHVTALDRPLADIHPLTAPNWYGTTPVGSTRFVGRLAEMWKLHSLLNATDAAQITGASVNIGQVSGLGGVGKSLLAEEYALHFGASYPGGVFWLRAYGNDDAKSAFGPESREAERTAQVQTMAERLGIVTQGLSAAQIEGALSRRIESGGKSCLWVVDDVPNGLDGEALRRWFAPHSLAKTLITTRSREYGSLVKSIDLSVLAPEEAYQLLTSRRPPASPEEEERARQLAADVGYHALALDVTASALQSSVAAAPFAAFRSNLANPDKDALELAKNLSDALPNGHEKSIAQTMLRSIRGLEAEGLDFLRLASVLTVAPIPGSLVTAVFELAAELSRDVAEERASLAFKQVTSASLAEVAGDNRAARFVHTLVSRTVRFQEKDVPERAQLLRAAAVLVVVREMVKVAGDPRIRGEAELHATHARQLVASVSDLSEAILADWLGQYELARGAYGSARALFARELEFRLQAQGEEHPDTSMARNNLAVSLSMQGDWAGAREQHEQLLKIGIRLLGDEHPDTLVARNNLAGTLQKQGDLKGARLHIEEVLSASRRQLGEEHSDTLVARNTFGTILFSLGDFPEAQQQFDEVLAARRQLQGKEHPDSLTTQGNLAAALAAQGDFPGARKHQEEVLAASQRLLGGKHPDTLMALSNLAITLQKQGDLKGARKHQEEVLTALLQLLGEEHADTSKARDNLGQTLTAEGDLAGAREQHERALEIRQRLLGPDHPDTTISAWNLFRVLQDLGKTSAAVELLRSNLLWLFGRDPATLGADQRRIREYVAKVVK